jgi:hypothetical protein
MNCSHLFGRSFSLIAVCASICLSILSLSANVSFAAAVTLNEAGMDGIYSQAGFGANTVDIRFNATVTLIKPQHLILDNAAEVTTLFTLSPAASPTVNLFFVDSILGCGATAGPGITGCASEPGNDMVVRSTTAAGGDGAENSAHELGHNFGLPHMNVAGNLMTALGFGNLGLTAGQITTILASNLIQTDMAGQRFVQITPVLIDAPEPATMCLVAFAALPYILRRQ